jgi:hypothetical protein
MGTEGWLGRDWNRRNRKSRLLVGLAYGMIMGSLTFLFWLWLLGQVSTALTAGAVACVGGGGLFVLFSDLNARRSN